MLHEVLYERWLYEERIYERKIHELCSNHHNNEIKIKDLRLYENENEIL